VPGQKTPAPDGPGEHRRSKKAKEIDRILHRTSHAGTGQQKKIFESDIAKIFGRNQRKGSQ
jgi:hypothetical protein